LLFAIIFKSLYIFNLTGYCNQLEAQRMMFASHKRSYYSNLGKPFAPLNS